MDKVNSIRSVGIKENVILRVIDMPSGKVVQEHTSHNTATNSMLTGIGHYLIGDGVLNQGSAMLSRYIPQYISLGTMGLITQLADSDGLPLGLGEGILNAENDPTYQALLEELAEKQAIMDAAKAAADEAQCCALCDVCPSGVNGQCPNKDRQSAYESALNDYNEVVEQVLNYGGSDEALRLSDYMAHRPGYGADGYDLNQNNNRKYPGLGPVFENRTSAQTINCELISDSFPRAKISFRDIVPEVEAELPMTIDIVYSAMISTGALRQFREPGKNYIFITEAGLWGTPNWNDSGENGLLAGYRIAPSDSDYWWMSADKVPDDVANRVSDEEAGTTDLEQKKIYVAERNRNLLKRSILRVGPNQVVQVIWKIQLGSIDQLGGFDTAREHVCPVLVFTMNPNDTEPNPETNYTCVMSYLDPSNPDNTPTFTQITTREENDTLRILR